MTATVGSKVSGSMSSVRSGSVRSLRSAHSLENLSGINMCCALYAHSAWALQQCWLSADCEHYGVNLATALFAEWCCWLKRVQFTHDGQGRHCVNYGNT